MNYHTYGSALFGRDEEVKILEDAFNRVCNGTFEMLLVKGMSGTGKTVLVHNTFTALAQSKGYFISGKFEQHAMNEPYIPFVQAFTNMVHYFLSESKEKIDSLRKKLRTILGTNSGIIASMIPKIDLIIGPQMDIDDIDIKKIKIRFERVFIKFLQAFATKDHPVVLFLDDLQWADEASLDLIKVITNDFHNKYLLIVCSYKEEEVTQEHPVASFIRQINMQNKALKEITLSNLNFSSTYGMVKSNMNLTEDSIQKIAELIFLKTIGNPFYIEQILGLIRKETFLYDENRSNSIGRVFNFINKIDHNEAILDMVFERIQRVFRNNIFLLKLVACIGYSFDLHTFAIITQVPSHIAAKKLKGLIEENLILPLGPNEEIITGYEYIDRINRNDVEKIHYRFIHDNIHKAVYSLLHEKEKKEFHYDIGRKLLSRMPETEITKNIFRITFHMNHGLPQMVTDEEKVKTAQLNLMAGLKAKSTSALSSAEHFFETGLKILPEGNHELAFSLYFELYQCRFLAGNLDEAHNLFEVLLEMSTNDIEKAKIYMVNTSLLSCAGRYKEAIFAGMQAMSYLDIPVKDRHYYGQLFMEVIKSVWLFRHSRLKKLSNLPHVKSEKSLLTYETIVQLAPSANLCNQSLYQVLVLYMANKTAREKSRYSPVGFAAIAIFSCGTLGNYKKAKLIEELSLTSCKEYDDPAINCITYFILSTFVTHWTSHAALSLEYACKSFMNGMESGEIFFIGYAMTTILDMKYVMGKPLDVIYKDCTEYYDYAVRMDFELVRDLINMYKQFINTLQGNNISINHFVSEVLEEKLMMKEISEILTYYILKAQLLLLKGNYIYALEIEEKAYKKLGSISGYVLYAEHIFYYSLSITLSYDLLSATEKKKYIKALKSNQRKMETWAKYCKENYEHKYLLIQAEIARIKNEQINAMCLFDKAIKSAKQYGYIQNAAIINECAAMYYKTIDRLNVAESYIHESYKGYQEWGAYAKAKQLCFEWENIFDETGDENRVDYMHKVKFNNTLSNIKKDTPINVSNVMNAYYKIMNESNNKNISLKLLEGLTDITGTDKGYVLSQEDGKLAIQASWEPLKHPSSAEPSGDTDLPLPMHITRYVARTHETVILNKNMDKGIFSKDVYIIKSNPVSMACFPFMYQDMLLGVIYLERSMATEGFDTFHIEASNILLDKVMNTENLKQFILTGKKNVRSKAKEENIQQLTPRELEVLELLGQGKSNKKIAEELNLTVSTIKTHLINVYTKLRVNTRIQAVMKAKALGLIED